MSPTISAPPETFRVLYVEDDPEDVVLVRDFLKEVEGLAFDLHWAAGCEEGLSALAESEFEVVLLDYRLGAQTGLDFLLRMDAEDETPVVLLTGEATREADLVAMKAGATDFLLKRDLGPTLLERSIRYAVERRRNQNAKSEIDFRYRLLVESAGAIVWQADPETLRFSLVSQEAEVVLGYPVGRWLNEPEFWLGRIHPADRDRVLASYTRTAATGESHVLEYRMIAADGREVWLRDVVRNAELRGRRQLVGVMVETTDLKHKEQALNESEERFRQLAASIPQVFWMHALPERRLLYVSAAYERVWGQTVQSLFDDPLAWLKAIHPEDQARVAVALGRLEAGEYEEEYRIQRPDGAIRWIRDRAYPIRDSSGRVYRMAGTAEDITEQHEAAEALTESEARFRSLAESALAAIFVADESSTITFANAAAERIFGHTVDELIGQPLTILMPEQSRMLHMAGVDRYLATGERRLQWDRVEMVGRSREGRDIPLEITMGTFQRGGRQYFTGIAQDITERKAAEEEQRLLSERLRQAQKMEAVGRLAGGVAHDFNNMLTAIGGIAQMVREELPDGPLSDDLEEVVRTVDRAAGLTRQLLAFSRQQVLQPRVLDLNAAVMEAGRMLRRLLEEDIELVILTGADRGRVEVDPVQVEQVLMNLAANARDAMPDGGRLTLKTDNVQLTEADARRYPYRVHTGSYVLLQVSDTGEGMDEATLQHIFEPFFTTKDLGKGTGLGLATVFGAVKQSGGYIWVDSAPGRGTTFDIYLPMVEKSLPPQPSSREPPSPTAGGETVLLVEDEDGVRRLARRILEKNGYLVLEASGADDALTNIVPTHVGSLDLLITDVVMPGMNGKELADRIREHNPHVRIIFMSGYTEDEVARRGIIDSGQRFLEKPFTPAQLARCVGEVLRGSAAP